MNTQSEDDQPLTEEGHLQKVENRTNDLLAAIKAALEAVGDDEKRLRKLYYKGLNVNHRVMEATRSIGYRLYEVGQEYSRQELQETLKGEKAKEGQ